MKWLLIWNSALDFVLLNLVIAGFISGDLALTIGYTSLVAAIIGFAEGFATKGSW